MTVRPGDRALTGTLSGVRGRSSYQTLRVQTTGRRLAPPPRDLKHSAPDPLSWALRRPRLQPRLAGDSAPQHGGREQG